MSVIQSIRDKGAWIVFSIIALALIAFILQDSSLRRGNMFSNTTTVGTVNGSKIERTQFESKLDFVQQMQGAQAPSRDQLMGSVWNYMIQQTVLKQETNKLGLGFTPKELSDLLFGSNPPSWIQQAFTDPATGHFNAEAARQQFNQMKKTPNDPRVVEVNNAYILPTVEQAIAQKYQALVTGAVNVPKWMVEKINADNNSIANISFAFVPYMNISDSLVKISKEEVAAYAKKHAKDYSQDEESRTISYVSFDAHPSKEDTANVINELKTLEPGFAAATNIKLFLSSNGTDLPYYDSYIGEKEIKQPNIEEIIKTPQGSVYGPYLDGNDFVLAKMEGIRTIPDSVKVRHILIATHQQQQTGGSVRVRDEETAKKLLDSAITELKEGKSFDSVCLKYSEDPGSKEKGGVYDYFSSGRMVPEFNDFCFTGKTGDKKVVETEYGFHYIEILGQKGSTTGYKIAYLAHPLEASAETINAANSAALQFSATSRDRKQFDDNAQKDKKQPVQSPEIHENDFTVGPLGQSRPLVKWIFENKIGAISEPFEVGNQYVVAMINSISKAGSPNMIEATPQIQNILRNEKKAKIIIDTKMKGASLEEIAKNSGTEVQKADSISFQSPFIPAVGAEPKISGAAFNKDIQGKLSPLIAGNTGVFAIKGEGISARASLGDNAEAQKETIENTLKQQINYGSIGALIKGANIKDYRSKFY